MADGQFTERTLNEYLVLASVFETCEFNNVNVLKFLLSKETTLAGLFKMARRKIDATLHQAEDPLFAKSDTLPQSFESLI